MGIRNIIPEIETDLILVIMKIVQSNGKAETINLPIEIWLRGGNWVYKYSSTGKIDKVILDPEKVLPDMDRKNNEWTNN